MLSKVKDLVNLQCIDPDQCHRKITYGTISRHSLGPGSSNFGKELIPTIFSTIVCIYRFGSLGLLEKLQLGDIYLEFAIVIEKAKT